MERRMAVPLAGGLLAALLVFMLWPRAAMIPVSVAVREQIRDRSMRITSRAQDGQISEWSIEDFMPRWDPATQFLFFSHIPRTSGGTFSTLLNIIFPPRFTHPGSSYARMMYGGWKNFLSATPEQWATWKVLYTHEDFSLIRYIPREVAALVFIREPAKQRRSLYDVSVQAKFKATHPDLKHWIGSAEFPRHYQVEWLAGVLSWWPYSKAPASFINALQNDTRLMLGRAIKNLAATTWFGITERMNESLCLFFYSHHIRPRDASDYGLLSQKADTESCSTIHASPNRIRSLSDEEELQRPLLDLEYEFFAVASQIFEARINWMKQDYEVNSRHTHRYVASECRGLLRDAAFAPGFVDTEEYDSREITHMRDETSMERGDPSRLDRVRGVLLPHQLGPPGRKPA